MIIDVIPNGCAAEGRNISKSLVKGIRAFGDTVRVAAGSTPRDKASDAVACWGWRRGERLRRQGREVLIVERGFIGDRLTVWTQLGWNGLCGRGEFPAPPPDDGGRRFETYFGGTIKPWTRRRTYALIVGQVPGDANCPSQARMEQFYCEAARAMEARGYEVGFREHPAAVRRGLRVRALPGKRVGGTLADALDVAAVVVTWSSNTAVEAVLAGVPVICCDPGSMAYPVAAQSLSAPLIRPDRAEWAARLAWTQWNIAEILSGEAWARVRAVRFPEAPAGPLRAPRGRPATAAAPQSVAAA
jgi:hypothetical protein